MDDQIRLTRNHIPEYYENGKNSNQLLNNIDTDTRIPPIVQYESFIVSNTEKTLKFSSLDTGIVYNPLSSDSVDVFFPTDTQLFDNKVLRLQFTNIFFHGTVTFDISGTIKLSTANDLINIHLNVQIDPEYYYLHDLASVLNEKIADKIDQIVNSVISDDEKYELKKQLHISYINNRLIFPIINTWHDTQNLDVTIFFYHTHDNDYFITDAQNVTLFNDKSKIIFSNIRKSPETQDHINYINIVPNLASLVDQLNFIYNIYNISAYELHRDYGITLQQLVDNIDFTIKNPIDTNDISGTFVQPIKYYLLGGDYHSSEYNDISFGDSFMNINSISHDLKDTVIQSFNFTLNDYYDYTYKGIIENGPPLAHEDFLLPYYTPNDLLYYSDGSSNYFSMIEIIDVYKQDIRSLYEDYAYPDPNHINYGLFSCQDLNNIANIPLQDIIDHLGPNNSNLDASLNHYYTNRRKSSTDSSDGRVSNFNMKTYIFSGFYSVGDIFNSTYRNSNNDSNIDFETVDYYTFGYLDQFRYYTPDVLKSHYTLTQIINEAGFSVQDLYDYNFKALELKNIRNSFTLENMINDISFNKSEEAENRIDEMKYYVFSADYAVDIIKNATYNNLSNQPTLFTANDFNIFAFIGDPNTDQRANMNNYGAHETAGPTIFTNIIHPVRPTIVFQQSYPIELVLPDSFPLENNISRLNPPYYTPNELRSHYTLNEIINESGFSLQNLYDYYFTSDEFRLQNIILQRQLNEIQFIKTNGTSNPSDIPEMKDYIFDGSYNIVEISQATYIDRENGEIYFTPTDFSNYASAYVNTHYSPDKLRQTYSVAEIMDALEYFKMTGEGNGSYSFQNLYDYNFTAEEFNVQGEVPLQQIVSNIIYNKYENQDQHSEMKYYIFDGSYSITEIFNANYDNFGTNMLFTPADFSIYAQQHETTKYRPQDLSGIFSLKHIIQGLEFYDGSYNLQRLYENNFSAFDLNTITHDTNNDDFRIDRNNIQRINNDGIEPQDLISNIIYNKIDGLNPTNEMKTYIFSALYTITKILDSHYIIGGNTSENLFTLNDFAVFGDVNMYSPQNLRNEGGFTTLAIINEYKAPNNNYTLQNLYDSDFSGTELNTLGNISLQTIIDNITYNKDDSTDPIDEMKYYIFDASYSAREITQATYSESDTKLAFSVKDFSIYSYKSQENTWIYNANSLVSLYTSSQIITGPSLDSSYTLLHFYEMYREFGNSIFSPHSIKEINNFTRLSSLDLQSPQTYFSAGYNVFDLHDTFKVFETIAVNGIDILDVIQDTNGDSTPDSGYSIHELFYDSNGAITISGENVVSGLKYHYTIKSIVRSLGFKQVMTVMGITEIDDSGDMFLPNIPYSQFGYDYQTIQNSYNILHLRNSPNHLQGIDRGLMDLQLDVTLYAAIVFDTSGSIIDLSNDEPSYLGNDTFLKYYFSALKLKQYYNYSYDALTGPGGYSSAELILANRSALDLFRAGVILTPGIQEFFSFEDLRNAGYSEASIVASQSKEITTKDLLGLGLNICDLKSFTTMNRTWSRFETLKPRETSIEYLAELQMRRKAESLKYNNNSLVVTQREKLKNILRGRKSNCTRGMTFASSNQYRLSNSNNTQLKRVNNTLILTQGGESTKSTPMPAYYSGVPGNTLLYLDKSVPLFGYLGQFKAVSSYSKS